MLKSGEPNLDALIALEGEDDILHLIAITARKELIQGLNCTIAELNSISADMNSTEASDAAQFESMATKHDLVEEIRTAQIGYDDLNREGFLLKNGIWVHNGIQL